MSPDKRVLFQAVAYLKDRIPTNTLSHPSDERKVIEMFAGIVEASIDVTHADVRDAFEYHQWSESTWSRAENLFDVVQSALSEPQFITDRVELIERWKQDGESLDELGSA